MAEALITYFNIGLALPSRVLLLGSGLALVTLFFWRILFSAAIRNRLDLERVLFLGFPAPARQIAGYLAAHPEIGFVSVGFLDRPGVAAGLLTRLGGPEDLSRVIESERPNRVVVGEQQMIASEVGDLAALRFNGVHLEDLASFGERIAGRIYAAAVSPSKLMLSNDLQPDPLAVKMQSM